MMMIKKCSTLIIIGILAVVLLFGLCSPVSANIEGWIPASNMEVLTPEANEILIAGSTVDISWQARSITINMAYSTDGGNTLISIKDNLVSGGPGVINHYTWTVPNITSESCTILIYFYEEGFGTRLYNYYYAESGEFKIHRTATITPQLFFQATEFIAAPTSLMADSTGSDCITLKWKDKSANEDGFKAERKTAGQPYVELASIPANAETFNDETAVPGTEYSYRIKAFKGSSSSAYSNEVRAAIEAEAVPTEPAEPEVPSEPESPATEPGQPYTSESDGVVMIFYIRSTEYYVNGRLETMDTAPLIFEGRTMLPIRYVADALGARVAWNAQERKVIVSGTKTIELSIDNPWARVDGALAFIDPINEKVTPVILPPGRTMLPLRFTAETLGCSVEWKPDIQEITLRYPQN